MQTRTRDQINDLYLQNYVGQIKIVISDYAKANTHLLGYIKDQNTIELNKLSLELDQILQDTTDKPFERYVKLLNVTMHGYLKLNTKNFHIETIIKNILINELATQEEAEWELESLEKITTENIVSAMEKIEEKAFYNSNEDYAFCKKWNVITASPVSADFPFWIQMQRDINKAFDDTHFWLVSAIIDQTFNVEKKSQVRTNDDDKIFSQPGADDVPDNIQSPDSTVHDIAPLSKERIKKELEIWTPENLIILFLDYTIKKFQSTNEVIDKNALFIHLKTILTSILGSIIKANAINKLLHEYDEACKKKSELKSDDNKNDLKENIDYRIECIKEYSYDNDNELLINLGKFELHWNNIEPYLSRQPISAKNSPPILSIDKYGHIEEVKKARSDHHLAIIIKPISTKLSTFTRHTVPISANNNYLTPKKILIGSLIGFCVFGGIGATIIFTGGLATVPFLGIAISTLAAKITAVSFFAATGVCLLGSGVAIASLCHQPTALTENQIHHIDACSDTKSMYRVLNTDTRALRIATKTEPASLGQQAASLDNNTLRIDQVSISHLHPVIDCHRHGQDSQFKPPIRPL